MITYWIAHRDHETGEYHGVARVRKAATDAIVMRMASEIAHRTGSDQGVWEYDDGLLRRKLGDIILVRHPDGTLATQEEIEALIFG